MSFRLVRGRPLEWVCEHYRKRNKEQEGAHPELEGRYDCSFDFGPTAREKGTLQRATFVMKNNPAPEYGETYSLSSGASASGFKTSLRCKDLLWWSSCLTPRTYASTHECGTDSTFAFECSLVW